LTFNGVKTAKDGCVFFKRRYNNKTMIN